MRVSTDKRRIKGKEDSALLRRVGSLLDRFVDLQLELAETLVEVQETKAFEREGAACLAEWAGRHRLEHRQTWELHRVGLAMRQSKALKKKVKEGTVPIENAAQLGRVVGKKGVGKKGAVKKGDGEKKPENGPGSKDPKGPKEDVFDDLLAQAETLPPEDFKETLDVSVEKGKTEGRKTEKVVLRLSRKGMRNLRRACDLESKAAKRKLTDAQALERILDEHLARKDPLRSKVGTRKRRAGKTSDDPANRRVPAKVERGLNERSKGRCEFPGCRNRIWTERAHALLPNALGGGQELHELTRLCQMHHTMLDCGLIALLGWSQEGRPAFLNKQGEVFVPGASGVPRKKVPRGTILKEHPQVAAARRNRRKRVKAPGGRRAGVDGPSRPGSPASVR